VLPWQDVLHAGPVPDVERGKLLQHRAGFLSDCGWGGQHALLSSLERRDRQFLDALHAGVQVVLWFEHDLYDQLQLLDALALARGLGAPPELIVVGSFPGKPGFAGLGELTAEELETLWPAREPAAEATLETAVSVWGAFRSADPAELAAWAAHEIPGLPFVAAALGRLLEELPAPGDGLSTTERHALEAVASGATTPSAAFLAAQRLEEAPFLGDNWFFRSLVELGSGDVGLVETADGEPLPAAPPLGDGQDFARLRLRLTEEGARVLTGELDRVELMGVDRWLGGTHVSADRVWRWDPAERTLS
jgi:hypothetical protein